MKLSLIIACFSPVLLVSGSMGQPAAPAPPQQPTDSQVTSADVPPRDPQTLKAAYWWRYGRYGYTGVSTGDQGIAGSIVPPAPTTVQALPNYDGSVAVVWAMPAGAAERGDVFQVGRRLPGQSDFWLVGETYSPRFTDRDVPPGATNIQYKVVVRRGGPEGAGGVYGPVSAVASASIDSGIRRAVQRVLYPAADRAR
ncbi:hypothetical protein PHYC_01501 [Phycisphaerales bacterium]|nr:hypothetical protein PHYC_01501 [Phycisphaerales bacterium]